MLLLQCSLYQAESHIPEVVVKVSIGRDPWESSKVAKHITSAP